MKVTEPKLPSHWIGAWKGWEQLCSSLAAALVELTPAELSTHCIAFGSTGSGKTTVMHHIIAGALISGTTVLVFDLRGDLALATLELAARVGIDPAIVKFLDLRDKHNPVGFDPLKGSGEPYHRALAVLSALEAQSESWGVQLAESLRMGLMLLAETGLTLVELEPLFHQTNFRTSLVERCGSDSVRAFWQRYDALSPDKQAAMAAPVLNKCSILTSTEGLRKMFGHPEPVNLREQLDTPGSVTIVSLGLGELHGAAIATGSILLSAIRREIFDRIDIPESKRNPVRVFVDEFHAFDSMDIESILVEGRRFRVSAVLATQALAQLSPKVRSVILGNVGIKIVFRVGRQDADILAKDIGIAKGTFDLARQQVGEAVLWRRGDEPWPVEINVPIFRNPGQLGPSGKRLLELLEEFKLAYAERNVSNHLSEPEPPKQRHSPRSQRSGDLEDWLK